MPKLADARSWLSSGSGRGVPEVQLREVIAVIAAVAREQALGVSLCMRGNEEVWHDAVTLAAALQI